jgi:hypothetical protein
MYILSALNLRCLFSSRTPVEHHSQPTLETTFLDMLRYNLYALHLQNVDMQNKCNAK